jgi:hypothetical protein
MTYSAGYQRRHNAIVERVKVAAGKKFQILAENETLDDSGAKPDLVLVQDNKAAIVDITIPFENRREALTASRLEKEEKYQVLAQSLRAKYAIVSVEAFIVGALGTWDLGNERLLKSICSRSYGSLMRKLCVSDVIQWSRDIYIQHITGIKQWTEKDPNALPEPASTPSPTPQ